MRGGSNGIASITRLLRIMDDDGDKRLSRSELKYVQLFILFHIVLIFCNWLYFFWISIFILFLFFTLILPFSARFGLRDYGIDLTPTELEQLFLYFDSSRDGFISVDEFLIGKWFLLFDITRIVVIVAIWMCH